MADQTFKIDFDVNRFNVYVRALAAGVEADAVDVLTRVVFRAEAEIKILTPVLTGFLHNSISGVPPGTEGLPKTRGKVRTFAYYAIFVELGTRYFEGRHMFRLGLAKVNGHVVSGIKAAIRRRAAQGA